MQKRSQQNINMAWAISPPGNINSAQYGVAIPYEIPASVFAQGTIPAGLIGGIAELFKNTASSDASQLPMSTDKKTPTIMAFLIIDSVTAVRQALRLLQHSQSRHP